MAFEYTSSPLGLITSLSEFNFGTSSTGIESIFTSYQSPGKKHILKKIDRKDSNAVLSNTPHNNDIYDVSTFNIIKNLKKHEPLALNFADFAYLKDFGIYPNNRLIVARRFPKPVVDDLYSLTDKESPGNPISTVLGYFGESEDIIQLSFNEEWEDADASFVNVLNELGEDFGMKGQFKLGSILEDGLIVVPLPGATLLLQRKIMKTLGIITDENDSTIPQGDPNLIKEAKARKLIGEDDHGAGLSCKISITLKTKYEQKFINGLDPTIVFMDILNNVLNMGTSVSTFYLGKQNDTDGKFEEFLKGFMTDPGKKIMDFIKAIIDAFKEQLDILDKKMKSAKETADDKSKKDGSGTNEENSLSGTITNLISQAVGKVTGYVADFIRAKYKVKFLGIISALTGGSSTPWHVTVGNPLRPIFCSGDMLCKGVDVNFGPQLSFNDLPTFIEVSVKLESARNLGLQEIFSKFNNGAIRTTEGQFKGDYLVGDSDTFWNFKQLIGTQNQTPEYKETQMSEDITKTDNSTEQTLDNTSKVTEPQTTEGITSNTNLTKEISSDPQSTDKITPAGANANSDNLRADNTQETTGSKEGVPDQMQGVDDKPYTGEDSKPITTPVQKSENVKTIYESIDVTPTTPPIYICIGKYDVGGKQVDGRGSGDSQQIAQSKAREDARNKAK